MPHFPKMHFQDDKRNGPLCGTDPRYADTTYNVKEVTCWRCKEKLRGLA